MKISAAKAQHRVAQLSTARTTRAARAQLPQRRLDTFEQKASPPPVVLQPPAPIIAAPDPAPTASVSSAFTQDMGAGDHSMLARGAMGPEVSELQSLLNQHGASLDVDGDFGPMTDGAVRAFQAAHGLDVDGVVGPITWGALTGSAPAAPVAPAPVSGGEPMLSQGARGGEVTQLQQLLQAAGIDPGPIDGDFGPRTAAAVRFYQATRGLSVDGVVGPQTWGALKANAPATVAPPSFAGGDVRDRILALARGELGTVEATNNNDGDVAKYPNFFGRPAQSWCANFVSWVYTNAGIDLNDPWCPSVLNKLVAEGKWKGRNDPQPGDLVLFDWDFDGVADHVGIVERDNGNGSITTIEGNTGNPYTGQEGVWERQRWMDGTIMGFGNP